MQEREEFFQVLYTLTDHLPGGYRKNILGDFSGSVEEIIEKIARNINIDRVDRSVTYFRKEGGRTLRAIRPDEILTYLIGDIWPREELRQRLGVDNFLIFQSERDRLERQFRKLMAMFPSSPPAYFLRTRNGTVMPVTVDEATHWLHPTEFFVLSAPWGPVPQFYFPNNPQGSPPDIRMGQVKLRVIKGGLSDPKSGPRS